MHRTLEGNNTARLQNFQSIQATVKNFDIEHPTKKNPWRLRYSSLEGPEAGVYLRGKVEGENVIILPEYWKDLVDQDTITVSITPVSSYANYYVSSIDEDKIIIGQQGDGIFNFHYVIMGERKDLDKLVVEYIQKKQS
jgi:hypothetical protein